MSFQSQVNLQPAPAVEGDFASGNVRTTVDAGPGGLVAGVGGVTVGRFAWVDPTDLTIAVSRGTYPKAPDGFVQRSQQALLTQYLQEAGNLIPEGFGVTLMNQGDFFVKVTGATAATALGQAVYANYADGTITIASASTGASATGSIGSTNTAALGATFTASADSDPTRLVVTSVTGKLHVGDVVSGVGITPGTTITSQVSGTAGAAGTYQLSASNTASAATVTSFGATVVVSSTTALISIGDTISGGAGFPVGATVLTQTLGTTGGAGTYTISAPGTAYVASATGVTTFGDKLRITAVASGVLTVGAPVTGTGVPANAVITAQDSGTTGGAGVYTISERDTAYAASTADIATTAGILTKFKTASIASVGELVKISSWN
jgi:hypothetical protein